MNKKILEKFYFLEMINDGFILLLNVIFYSNSQIIFEFKRDLNLNETMPDKEIFTTIAYNDLYTYIKLGTPEKELKVSISFEEKSLVILGSKIKRLNVFNESNSDTYKKISDEIYLIKNQIFNGYISEDIIKLNKLSLKIKFFLGEEIYKEKYSFNDEYEPINYAGYLGLAITSLFNGELPDSLPIYLYNNYKDDYNFKLPFSIIFDNLKNKAYKGKLILNGFPHEYNNLYNVKNYISSTIQYNEDNLNDWCLALDNVYYGNNIVDENKKIIFRPEFGIIIVSGTFFNYLTDNYFKEYKKENICNLTTFDLIGYSYNYYYCSKEIDLKKFKEINFELKDINFNFSINYEDLFFEYNNKYYFLMIAKNYKNNNFVFGSILMKKYNFVFDKYNRKIGFYTDLNVKKKKNIWLICSISILSVLIIIVLIFIIWNYYFKIERNLRKNEINDDYNYVSNEDSIN